MQSRNFVEVALVSGAFLGFESGGRRGGGGGACRQLFLCELVHDLLIDMTIPSHHHFAVLLDKCN